MARLIVALAMLGGAAAQLSIDAVNPKVVEAEYAVRGKILDRAGEIERDMAENPDKWPFKEIVRCNIGNPQALGQAPPAFARAVLSQVVLPNPRARSRCASAPTRIEPLYEVASAPTPTPRACH